MFVAGHEHETVDPSSLSLLRMTERETLAQNDGFFALNPVTISHSRGVTG